MPKSTARIIDVFDDELREVTYDQFSKYENSPVQRNHPKRATESKHQNKLNKFRTRHRVVFAVKLSVDAYDPTTGITWDAGTIFLVDGHTRREYWNKWADECPFTLLVHMSVVSTMEEVRDEYYAHDNTDNVEKNSDLAYGATRSWDTILKNDLFKVMPITWASYFTKSKEFPRAAGWKGPDFINGYRLWKEELLFLNDINWSNKIKLPASLTCASLIFLKANDMNETSKDIVKRVYANKFTGPDDDDKLDAITNILEWIKNTPKEDMAHNFNTMGHLVERFCYWLKQAEKESRGESRLQKYGGKVETTPTKDCFVKMIDNLSNLKQAA